MLNLTLQFESQCNIMLKKVLLYMLVMRQVNVHICFNALVLIHCLGLVLKCHIPDVSCPLRLGSPLPQDKHNHSLKYIVL